MIKLLDNPLWGIFLTLIVFITASILQKRFKFSLLNPLLVSSIVIIIFLSVSSIDFETYNNGARFISMFVGPATVALAIPLYQNIHLLKKHKRTILLSILAGILAHTLTIAGFALVFHLDGAMIATYLPKSVTTAIAADLSSSLGGIPTLTICIVIVTGILGASFGPLLNRLFRVKDPLAQGLALGVAAHAVGTSKAFELGKVQGAMATLALILTGIITVLLSPLSHALLVHLLS